jgi:hypothetical protein
MNFYVFENYYTSIIKNYSQNIKQYIGKKIIVIYLFLGQTLTSKLLHKIGHVKIIMKTF